MGLKKISTLEAQSGILATRKHEQGGEDIGMDLDIFYRVFLNSSGVCHQCKNDVMFPII